jgi:hypothetical protein
MSSDATPNRSASASTRIAGDLAADFERARVLELLQQFEVVVAGNAEQMPDAGFVETAKQKVADLHSWCGAAGHSFWLLPITIVDEP